MSRTKWTISNLADGQATDGPYIVRDPDGQPLAVIRAHGQCAAEPSGNQFAAKPGSVVYKVEWSRSGAAPKDRLQSESLADVSDAIAHWEQYVSESEELASQIQHRDSAEERLQRAASEYHTAARLLEGRLDSFLLHQHTPLSARQKASPRPSMVRSIQPAKPGEAERAQVNRPIVPIARKRRTAGA
jgi:hypothetical protein